MSIFTGATAHPLRAANCFALTPISRRIHQRGFAHSPEAVAKCVPSDTPFFKSSSRKRFHMSRQGLSPGRGRQGVTQQPVDTGLCEAARPGTGVGADKRGHQDSDKWWMGAEERQFCHHLKPNGSKSLSPSPRCLSSLSWGCPFQLSVAGAAVASLTPCL